MKKKKQEKILLLSLTLRFSISAISVMSKGHENVCPLLHLNSLSRAKSFSGTVPSFFKVQLKSLIKPERTEYYLY